MMQDTLKLISIQHELGMAIGLDLRLKPMLKEFIVVALKRLGLAGVDFYIDSSASNKSNEGSNQKTLLSHVLSIPVINKQSTQGNQPDIAKIFRKLKKNSEGWHQVKNEASGSYTYYFYLDSIGLICFHRRANPLDASYLALLSPIFKRLAISCQASLEHEQLLQAIEARKIAESTITYQLLHDELTRLPNRRMLMDVLNQDVARAREQNVQGALLFIDLDRFKSINDTLGHEVGDELLKSVAVILQKSVRKRDLVARLSGDEFVIVIKNIQSGKSQIRKVVDLVLKKIYREFLNPIQAGKHLLHVSPSIGIEFYPWENATSEKILRNADTAMYLAKAQSQYSAVFYETRMSAELEQRLEIEKKLQDAVKTCQQFSLEHQPQYNSRGEFIGAEALTRWKLPGGDNIPPALFIGVAEDTGLILDLGKWVIKTACKNISNFERVGLPKTFKNISVNVSAVQFNQEEFVPDLIREVERSKITPSNLGIELTESTLINNVDVTRDKIALLETYGIEVSVDDFGTGYSSLSYLNRLPISTLKIDQSFIRNMHVDQGNRAIVATIIALAQSLSLSVVAEGVEAIEEFLCLQNLNCEYYQGFHFGASVNYKQLLEFIKNHTIQLDGAPSSKLRRRHTDVI